MVPDLWTVLQAALLVAGLLWCKEVLGRFRDDLALVRDPRRPGDRGVVLFYWALTLGALLLMGRFILGLALELVRALR